MKIQCLGISKTYESKDQSSAALNNIDLDLPETGLICILGSSGCGKTTLLNILGGLDSPTSGKIFVDGKDLSSYSEKEMDAYRNKKIGFVFQEYDLLPGFSVLENVRLAVSIRRLDPKMAKDKAAQALEAVGLGDKLKSKPNELSGGQKQRAAIARALVGDPELILADEPTGALDSKNGVQVMKILKEQSRSRLVLVVTHNEGLATEYADHIFRMKDGRIEEQQSLEEVRKEARKDSDYGNTGLGIWGAIRFGLSHITHRFSRFLMVSLSAAFGVVFLTFVLCINNGFGGYIDRVNRQTGSTMSYIVPAYNSVTDNESWQDMNQTEEYPDASEIYPYYKPQSSTTYVYNGIDSHYFAFLDQLKEDGILSDYLVNYAHDGGMKVLTDEPVSLAGNQPGGVMEVNIQSYASMAPGTGGMPYAPTNVFHPLFGDYEKDYDLLAGRFPSSENELVLIVDKRNSVDFSTLRALGFYNSADTQDQILNPALTTKVEPFSFEKVLGKSYSVYDLDSFYASAGIKEATDGIGIQHSFEAFYPAWMDESGNTDQEKLASFRDDNSGTVEAEIVGIIRPSAEISSPAMRTGIGYPQELSNTISSLNKKSKVAAAFSDVFAVRSDQGISDILESLQKIQDSGEEMSSTLIQSQAAEAFMGYAPVSDGYRSNPDAIFAYTSLGGFFSDASAYMADLIQDEFKGISLNDSKQMTEIVDSLSDLFMQGETDQAMKGLQSLCALAYSYSDISSLTLIPVSLETTAVLQQRLTDYNDIKVGSVYHAQSENARVYASNYVYSMARDLGQAVSMVNTIMILVSALAALAAVAISAAVTNMSVLERTKEIGVLRSLGASKKDVGFIFEAEAFMAGIFGGLIGVLCAFLITFPVNAVVDLYYPEYDVGAITQMAWWHPLVMVGFAIVLSLISALVPSLKAARKDPVRCLHSDN